MKKSTWASIGMAISLAAPLAFAQTLPCATIADIIERSGGQFDQNSNDFDLLQTALAATELTAALDGAQGTLTLFAPTDAAFVTTARDLGFTGADESGAWQFLVTTFTTLGGGDPIPTLRNVLLYHVSPERLNSFNIRQREFRNETIPTLLTGAVIRPQRGTLVDNDPDFANPVRIAPRDVRASNGLIQTINRVLLPINLPSQPTTNTIADIVAASGGTFDANNNDFDILFTAVQTAGLVDELQNPTSRLTVFAPTDAAFIATARDFGFTGTDENGAWLFLVNAFTTQGGGNPVGPLTDVLLFHILPFKADSAFLNILDQANLAVRPLFRNSALRFEGLEVLDFADAFRNPRRTANPVTSSNGNIFPIDRVLLPLDR